jgi:hypothetical protein
LEAGSNNKHQQQQTSATTTITRIQAAAAALWFAVSRYYRKSRAWVFWFLVCTLFGALRVVNNEISGAVKNAKIDKMLLLLLLCSDATSRP